MIPLHVVSSYSLSFGVHSPEHRVRWCKERHIPVCALTDRGNLYGLHEFLQACAEHGVRPIPGVCIVEGNRDRLLALARNSRGLSCLFQWITEWKKEGGSPVDLPSWIRRCLPDAFIIVLDPELYPACGTPDMRAFSGGPDRCLFAGMVQPRLQQARAAAAFGLEPVAVPRFCLDDPADEPVHRVLRAIGENTDVYRVIMEPSMPANRIPEGWFDALPRALENMGFIAGTCRFVPPFELVFPGAPPGGGGDPVDRLREAARAGAEKRYGELSDSVLERMEYELAIIAGKGFAEYFLVVQDIVRLSPRICGRGSGAASLVAYCLGITNVDPLRHHLYFERFLHPERTDPPDIDVDFAWDEREAVIREVMRRYGPERCAMVATHIRYQRRSALREAARAYGMGEAEIARAQKALSRARRFSGSGAGKAPGGLPVEPPWPDILAVAARLRGLPRHLGVHPGGLVITPGPLCCHTHVERAPGGMPVVAWEKDGVEAAGLVKIDLLGNRSLAVIRDALANLRENGVELDEGTWLPQEDPATVELLARGDTMGVFYVESPAMRQLQQKTRRGDFGHIVIHSSIIRPAANRFIREYVRRLHGAPVPSLHPAVDAILAETHGILCYQEDVSRVAVALAGFSPALADRLRKIISKKERGARLEQFREAFFAGAKSRGATGDVIRTVWDMMLSFDGYSFCKPHSASYAMVSFQSAYLRAHHPAEFMAAVISNRGGYYSTLAYVSEARRMGLTLCPVDVNRSRWSWRGKGDRLRVGFLSVSGLRRDTVRRLEEERRTRGSFGSLKDFFTRVRPEGTDVEALVSAGAFDSLCPGRTRQLWEGLGAARVPVAGDWTPDMRRRRHFSGTGFLVDGHPLALFRLPGRGSLRVRHLTPGMTASLWVWPVTAKTILAGSAWMEFVSFEDETGLMEAVLFPDVYGKYAHLVEYHRPCRITGVMREDQGALTFHVRHMTAVHP